MLSFKNFLLESKGSPRNFFAAKNFKELYNAICKITDEDEKISQVRQHPFVNHNSVTGFDYHPWNEFYIVKVPRYIPNVNLSHENVVILYEISQMNSHEYRLVSQDQERRWANIDFEFLKNKLVKELEILGVFERYEMRHYKNLRGKKSAHNTGIL